MKVILQKGLRGLSGGMEDWVYQMRDGKTYLGPKPTRKKAPSEAVIAHRKRFKEATVHAKSALADPDKRAFYESIAKQRGINARALAIGDFLNCPEFTELDLRHYQGQVGDTISIRAEDDLGFADVEVKIVSQTGTPIEQGKAIENGVRSGMWTYIATAPVTPGTDVFIEVVGFDHAGTEAKITENPTVGREN